MFVNLITVYFSMFLLGLNLHGMFCAPWTWMTAFALVSGVHETFRVPCKSGVSVSSSPLWTSYSQAPRVFHLGGRRFDFITSASVLISHGFFYFGYRIYFLVYYSLFFFFFFLVNACSPISCDFSVMRGYGFKVLLLLHLVSKCWNTFCLPNGLIIFHYKMSPSLDAILFWKSVLSDIDIVPNASCCLVSLCYVFPYFLSIYLAFESVFCK